MNVSSRHGSSSALPWPTPRPRETPTRLPRTAHFAGPLRAVAAAITGHTSDVIARCRKLAATVSASGAQAVLVPWSSSWSTARRIQAETDRSSGRSLSCLVGGVGVEVVFFLSRHLLGGHRSISKGSVSSNWSRANNSLTPALYYKRIRTSSGFTRSVRPGCTPLQDRLLCT
jgi:hypothetical protein